MTTTTATTPRRSTSALLFGTALLAGLALVVPAGGALAHDKATTIASHEPAPILAKIGAVQTRMSVAT